MRLRDIGRTQVVQALDLGLALCRPGREIALAIAELPNANIEDV